MKPVIHPLFEAPPEKQQGRVVRAAARVLRHVRAEDVEELMAAVEEGLASGIDAIDLQRAIWGKKRTWRDDVLDEAAGLVLDGEVDDG